MAYQEGDTSPPHTNVHNDVRTQLDELSTEFEIPVVLPPVVGLGDVGHVNHHNLFTTAIDELSKHECEDGLDGLGGWAEITEVSGSPKRYAYNDGGTDWVAFEWTTGTTTGTFADALTVTDGLLDVLVVSGGGMNSNTNAFAGQVHNGVRVVTAGTYSVEVGKGGNPAHGSSIWDPNDAGPRWIIAAPQSGYGAGNWGTVNSGPNARDGVFSAITETNIEYAGGAGRSLGTPGSAAQSPPEPSTGFSGVVICRVPAAQAAGVDPGSWVTRIDHYAEVTDGIVTDTYQERFYGDGSVRTENGRYASPEQPDDLIPCDPNVAEGWTYADGEFTPPPPDPSWREEAIKALQEQIKELQKDMK
ncbi:MAG: hypothetical protein VXA23_06585 [Actinomycetota bacterium]